MGCAIEIIKEGSSGLFAKPFDGADMAQKVEWLLDHPQYQRTMKEQAYHRAQQYRWESILKQLFDNYEDVLQETKRRRQMVKAA